MSLKEGDLVMVEIPLNMTEKGMPQMIMRVLEIKEVRKNEVEYSNGLVLPKYRIRRVFNEKHQPVSYKGYDDEKILWEEKQSYKADKVINLVRNS